MNCPDCGKEAWSGKVGGSFWFEPTKPAPARGRARRWAFLEAQAKHCPACRWTDIACATLRSLRRVRGEVLATCPGPCSGGACPRCSQALVPGTIPGRFHFIAQDRPRRGLWREILTPSAGVWARAEAQLCYHCSWLGVECATFVEPKNTDTSVIIYEE